MGILQPLTSQGVNPHGPLGWITAWLMPLFLDTYSGDLAELLDLQPQDDVLDVACGSGAFLEKRASYVRHVAGVDHSEIQIRLARKRLHDRIASGTAEIVQGDSAALPWKDETFSAVTCNCLSCFAEPERSLQEMYRVLRQGGRAAFMFDCCVDEEAARREEQKWGLPHWTEAEFRTMLVDAGFSRVSIAEAKKQMLAGAVKV